MKIKPKNTRETASVLVIVMILGAVSLLLLVSTMNWTSTTATIVDSSNRYSKTLAAAEAATEKVTSRLMTDFSKQGASVVTLNMSKYPQLIPTKSESAYWANYQFSDGKGNKDAVSVSVVSNWASGVQLTGQYKGLMGYAASYRIKADATDVGANHVITGAVQQDLQLALVPIFQFAIFYNTDLEINPGADMTITGRVHGNNDIYTSTSAKLTYNEDVGGSGKIYLKRKDLSAPGTGQVIFNADHTEGVPTLNLPIGSDNTPAAVHAIVKMPPSGESVTSDLGKQRFYNTADLVIVVQDPLAGSPTIPNVTAIATPGGKVNGGTSTTLGWSSVSNFVTLKDKAFTDQRENKPINVTEINVGNLSGASAIKSALGYIPSSIYVVDNRTNTSAGSEPGVRLVNGSTLPNTGNSGNSGLTVATPEPLYVQGNYNGTSTSGSDTSKTLPAALIGDSINVLSGAWNDANSTKVIGSRTATATTVNAAFLAGIVPTSSDGKKYSGGVENFPRFLENWDKINFNYNGSMVVLFTSEIGNAAWPGTGTIYNPPQRNWTFDKNFLDPNKLPPICPCVRAVIRGQWASIAPGT